MATAVIAELDPATGEVVVANAGHLPVLHATAAAPTSCATAAVRHSACSTRSATPRRACNLAGDERLLLFSDGLIERRGVDLTESLEALRDLVANGPSTRSELLDAVLGVAEPDRQRRRHAASASPAPDGSVPDRPRPPAVPTCR